MRSAVYNAQKGPRQAAAAVMNATSKLAAVTFLFTLRPFRTDKERLRMLVDSLPTPVEPSPIMEAFQLVQAMDELIRARVEVHLVGSGAAIRAADELLNRSNEFLSAVETQRMSLVTVWRRSLPAESERKRMLEAHEKFLTTIRFESKATKQGIFVRSRATP